MDSNDPVTKRHMKAGRLANRAHLAGQALREGKSVDPSDVLDAALCLMGMAETIYQIQRRLDEAQEGSLPIPALRALLAAEPAFVILNADS